MSTDLAVRDTATLFAGATPSEVIQAATDAANELKSVITQRHLFQRIGSRDHVLVEGWQTVGVIAGVFAVKDGGVDALPWPIIPNDGLPGPTDPGREPRRSAPEWPVWKQAADRAAHWEEQQTLIRARDRGLTFGFRVAYRAVKDGREVGWGEGRCTRAERNWASRDDYALASMAQTRGQSRALRQPLGFVVSLAGYATTPAEEVDGGAGVDQPAPPDATIMLDEDAVLDCAHELQSVWPDLDANSFMRVLARRFQGGDPRGRRRRTQGVGVVGRARPRIRAPRSARGAAGDAPEPEAAHERAAHAHRHRPARARSPRTPRLGAHDRIPGRQGAARPMARGAPRRRRRAIHKRRCSGGRVMPDYEALRGETGGFPPDGIHDAYLDTARLVDTRSGEIDRLRLAHHRRPAVPVDQLASPRRAGPQLHPRLPRRASASTAPHCARSTAPASRTPSRRASG